MHISEERRRLMQELELRANGRYYWKFWAWLICEIAGAGLLIYVGIHR